MEALNETVNYIKTELMPNYDYDSERPVRTERSSDSSEEHHHQEQQPKTPLVDPNNSEATTPNATPQIGDDEQVDWNK